MDPKLSGLDPKLQDAYNRVMNGPSTLPGQTPAPAAPNPTPSAQPNPQNPTTPHLQTPSATSTTPPENHTPSQPSAPTLQNPIPEPAPVPVAGFQNPTPPSLELDQMPSTPVSNQASVPTQVETSPSPTPAINSTMAFNANNSTVTTSAPGTKPKKNILPVVIGIFIPIFLVVYAIVWMVIFDMKLPFIGG